MTTYPDLNRLPSVLETAEVEAPATDEQEEVLEAAEEAEKEPEAEAAEETEDVDAETPELELWGKEMSEAVEADPNMLDHIVIKKKIAGEMVK